MQILPLPDEISDNWEAVEEMEAEIDTYYLLKRLPKRQKECFELLLEGYTYQEIADKLGISINTTREHIKRARNCVAKMGYSVL